jgi:hypothetical protein
MDKDPRDPGYAVFHDMPEFQQIDPQEHQSLAGGSGPFLEEGNDDMLLQELIRIKTPGLFLCIG